MKLSKRIMALYDAVNPGESVADIGTDHGYVPLLLKRDGISPKVIMSDISSGSLSKAINNFALVDICIDESCFRVGDGLTTIENGEVDDIIIAGLGGMTIIDILSEDLEKTRSFRKFILQPRNSSGELRCYLYSIGYDIVRENLTSEGKFICEDISAVRSDECYERIPPYEASDIRWSYPEAFVEIDTELLENRLKWKFQSILDEISSLKKSTSDMSERIAVLESDYKYLENLLRRNREYHG